MNVTMHVHESLSNEIICSVHVENEEMNGLFGMQFEKWYAFRALFLISVLLALSGCYQLDKVFHKGSVRAFASCLEDRSDLVGVLSEAIIRADCIDENQESLPRSFVSRVGGRLGMLLVNQNTELRVTSFSLTNIPDNYVVTQIALDFYLYNADGERFIIGQSRREWIEGPTDIFTSERWNVSLPSSLYFSEGTNFIGCSNADVKINCFEWNILNLKGLKY